MQYVALCFLDLCPPLYCVRHSVIFNTTISALPISRNMPSDSTLIGFGRIPKQSISEKGSSVVAGSIPKKGMFQQQPSQRPHQHHHHIQSRKERHSPEIAPAPANADLSENVNLHGIWRPRTRAPSGTDAIPLQKHTQTRMVRKGNNRLMMRCTTITLRMMMIFTGWMMIVGGH